MKCKVKGCQRTATTSWATVSVCDKCYSDLMTEQKLYYSNKLMPNERTMYKSIYPMTPWKRLKAERGSEHKAIAQKVGDKGIVTVYEIRGRRYVLDHPSTYKGAKAK